MEMILIVSYIVLNLYYIIKYFRLEKGVFTPPFLVSCISISVMLPQLTTIYYSSSYDNTLIPRLVIVMISGNYMFVKGFEIAINDPRFKTNILDLHISQIKYVILLFSFVGLYSIKMVNENLADGVIQANVRAFSQIALVLSSIFLLKERVSKIIILSFICAIIPIVHFAFFVYGSRGSTLFMFLLLMYITVLRFPKFENKIKIIVLIFLTMGSIVSASISTFRENVIHNGRDRIEYFENFKKSFTKSDSEVGMDLGNAALLMDYCETNGSYDYGFSFWNKFVYNYVPGRFVGQSFKESLQTHPDYEAKIPIVTHMITTTTGYFSAFGAWGYMGCFLFGFIGFVLGKIWKYSFYSNMYLVLYIYTLGNVPLMITHNFQYVFARLEMMFIFIFPILWYWIYRKNIFNVQ